MDERAKYRWIAQNILPVEREIRHWLRVHVRSLAASDVDDIVQEAYSRLWTAEFSAIANPRAYFYRIARNLVHARARRARVVPMELMGEIDQLGIISDEPGPERRFSARQELDRLMTIVAKLPPQCRKAFELRKFEGLAQAEVAAAMGITESTVEKHLAKALTIILDATAAQLGGQPHEDVAMDQRDRGKRHGDD